MGQGVMEWKGVDWFTGLLFPRFYENFCGGYVFGTWTSRIEGVGGGPGRHRYQGATRAYWSVSQATPGRSGVSMPTLVHGSGVDPMTDPGLIGPGVCDRAHFESRVTPDID